MSKLHQVLTLFAELTPAEKAQVGAALQQALYPPGGDRGGFGRDAVY